MEGGLASEGRVRESELISKEEKGNGRQCVREREGKKEKMKRKQSNNKQQ